MREDLFYNIKRINKQIYSHADRCSIILESIVSSSSLSVHLNPYHKFTQFLLSYLFIKTFQSIKQLA